MPSSSGRFSTSVRFEMPLVVEVQSEWGAVLLGGLLRACVGYVS